MVRFKIELSFGQDVHLMGTYAYHFWMADVKSIWRAKGSQSHDNRYGVGFGVGCAL
jgi:hypothetical protein